MQQGGRPTPFDRNMGTKTAAKSLNWLVQQLNVEGALFILFYQINSFWIFEYVVLRCIRCWKRHGFHKVQDIVLFAGTACQGLPVPAHCRPKVRDRLPGKNEKDAYFLCVCRIDSVHSESDPELSTGDTQAIVFVFQFRRWKHVWWKQTRSIMRILAQHDSTYATESEIVKSPDEVAALWELH